MREVVRCVLPLQETLTDVADTGVTRTPSGLSINVLHTILQLNELCVYIPSLSSMSIFPATVVRLAKDGVFVRVTVRLSSGSFTRSSAMVTLTQLSV